MARRYGFLPGKHAENAMYAYNEAEHAGRAATDLAKEARCGAAFTKTLDARSFLAAGDAHRSGADDVSEHEIVARKGNAATMVRRAEAEFRRVCVTYPFSGYSKLYRRSRRVRRGSKRRG